MDKLFKLISNNKTHYKYSLQKKNIISFFERLFAFLFPCSNKEISKSNYTKERDNLKNIFISILNELALFSEHKNKKLGKEFFASLVDTYKTLIKDAEVFKKFDPAAFSIQEIISCYPGFYAVSSYRIAHSIDKLGIILIPRVISEYCHSITGVDIHPKAKIGDNFFIDHGTGIVIGETTLIKNNVKIYQGVTLGAKTVFNERNIKKRHPTIEDNVIIYSNATILGGETVVGANSIIGGNVWLTKSIEPNCIVHNDFKELEIKKLKNYEQSKD